MTSYLILLILVTASGIVLCELKKSRRNDLIFLVIFGLVMLAMCSLRATPVGIDNDLYYLPHFAQTQGQPLSFIWSEANVYRSEPGYSLLVYLIAQMGDSATLFFSVQAFLTIGLTVLFVWLYSPSVWVGVFTFISFGFFGYTMCTLRQQLAICIMMFALPHLQKKRPIPYFAIVVIAALFHKSLWVLIPVYFLAWIPLNWKTISAYAAGTALVLVFTEPLLDFVTKFVYQAYDAENYYRAVGRDLQTAVVPILLCLSVLLLRKRLLERNPENLPLMNFSVYACCLFLLTLQTFIYQRLALIFLPVAVLLLPAMLEAMKSDPKKLAEVEALKEGKAKQTSQRYAQLKMQLRDEKALYYCTLGFILFVGWMYYLFLLNANRLLLVPYEMIL